MLQSSILSFFYSMPMMTMMMTSPRVREIPKYVVKLACKCSKVLNEVFWTMMLIMMSVMTFKEPIYKLAGIKVGVQDDKVSTAATFPLLNPK